MLNTENLLQSLHQIRLPRALIDLVAKWSALCDKPLIDPNVLQVSTSPKLATNGELGCYKDDTRLLELLRRYALLSSQPVLSEAAAEQISQILELAELDDGLALLLSQVDQALLESTDLLNSDAQDFYADQTSRILEFLTPASETSCSKELLNALLDQCAAQCAAQCDQSDASYVLSIEDPPDLRVVITSSLSYSKSHPSVQHRSKLLIAAFTTVAALVTGVVIVGKQVLDSLSQIPNSPWQPVKTSPIQVLVETHPKLVPQQLISPKLQTPANRIALLDRQQFAASQQFQIEQAQLEAEQRQQEAEQRQQEAEQKQILAEQQNQYQEAQYWHYQAQQWYQEAQSYLKRSQSLQENARKEIVQLPKHNDPKSTVAALQSNNGATLFASTFITKLLIEWALFLLLSALLMLSLTAIWKRGFDQLL